jgi:hypothetical protein
MNVAIGVESGLAALVGAEAVSGLSFKGWRLAVKMARLRQEMKRKCMTGAVSERRERVVEQSAWVLLVAALLLAGCDDKVGATNRESADLVAPSDPESGLTAPAIPTSTFDNSTGPEPRRHHVLTTTGYGPILVGSQVASLMRYELAAENEPNLGCQIFFTHHFPGLAIMAQDGAVVRLSAYAGDDGAPDIQTERHIGVQSAERAVRAAYEPLIETPHTYSGPPAKDLVWQPDSETGLRFEIGSAGRVDQVHAGLIGALILAEGCS